MAGDRWQASGPLFFISAAEPSADLHGAGLIRATRAAYPGARFVGVAGPAMVEAGCDRIFDLSRHSAMLLSAVRLVGQAAAMMHTCDEHLRRYAFDAAVLIDSPTLHLPLAGRAQAAGVPVLYYVAPQLWAWGASRIYKLRHRVDKLAVILPFEEEYFRAQGVDARFVGHPLAEHCGTAPLNTSLIRQFRERGSPFVVLLPGSRKHVVRQVLPGQLEVASRIQGCFPDAAFGVSVANAEVRRLIECQVQGSPLRLSLHADGRSELIRSADLAIVASGTTTLEVAFHGRPMIVMYNASRLFYHLFARWMVRTEHLSLPNILGGRKVVPEFMPYYRSIEPIAECAIALLRSPAAREAMSAELRAITEPLRCGSASRETAKILLRLSGRAPRSETPRAHT